MNFQSIFGHTGTSSNLWNSLLEDQPSKHKQGNLDPHTQRANFVGDRDSKQGRDPRNCKVTHELGKMINWTDIIEDLEIPNDCLGPNPFIDQSEPKQEENIPSAQFGPLPRGRFPDMPGKLDDQVSACSIQLETLSADLLVPKNLKRQWRKNTNIPKFLVRIYLKHFPAFNTNKTSKVLNHYKRVKKQLKNRSSNDYKIRDIQRLFETDEMNRMVSANNRRVMASIITAKASQEINGNNYIHSNQLSYMVALKIYNLRCRSSVLTQRVKIF